MSFGNHTSGDGEDHEMVQSYHADAALFAYIPAILYAMHLLYEDLKLDNSLSIELSFLSEFLYQLAMDFTWITTSFTTSSTIHNWCSSPRR